NLQSKIGLVAARGRAKIIGKIKSDLYSCIFTIRGEKIRIISCRRSRKNERSIYHEKIGEDNI
ncbi:MAG: BrnT family toxin, partial [bacterium]|nr:BrnT family toxin [bacterium]